MAPDEFVNWMAWERVRGVFGEQRGDLRNGILCALLKNIAVGFDGKRGDAKASDFMPYIEEQRPKKEASKKDIAKMKSQIAVLEGIFGTKEGHV